jgi:hypothetical protein
MRIQPLDNREKRIISMVQVGYMFKTGKKAICGNFSAQTRLSRTLPEGAVKKMRQFEQA